MAYDKIIDSKKLNGAITATADAIRSRTGKSDKIAWDEETGFSGAIKTQTKSVTPGASGKTVKSDSGYIGLSQVTVNGDSDLKAANIAKGVSIFGVTGTLESGAETAAGFFTPAQYSDTMIWQAPVTVSGLAFRPSRVVFYVDSCVSNCDGVLMYDSGTSTCVGRWTEYCEEDDYDDIYCGALNCRPPKVTFNSDGFTVDADEEGEYGELRWFPCKYRYFAIK